MEGQKTRLHPLVAGAAAAVIVAAGVGVAAITGVLPGSKADTAPEAAPQAKPAQPARTHVAAGKGTGIGAIAGGVGGAVIGHQIGENRAGTAVGAVVGAVAGHQVERKAREHKKYEITVRMHDGSTRSLSDETGAPLAFKSGDKVRVSQDGTLKPI